LRHFLQVLGVIFRLHGPAPGSLRAPDLLR